MLTSVGCSGCGRRVRGLGRGGAESAGAPARAVAAGAAASTRSRTRRRVIRRPTMPHSPFMDLAATAGRAVPTVQIDNELVRVTEWRFAPGAATGHHRHEMDYVVVPLTTGRLAAVTASGV